MEQRTQEWLETRAGKATASRVKDIVAKTKTGVSASRKNYLAQLVVERFTGIPEASELAAVSKAVQWGIDVEPEARAAYEARTGDFVKEEAFCQHPTITMSGASPDGLVGDDGLLEIKCPNTATHIEYLLSGKPPSEYLAQMAWQLACSGRKWVDFVSYDPRMPEQHRLFIVRYMRDDKYISELEAEVIKFLAEVDEMVKKLEEL